MEWQDLPTWKKVLFMIIAFLLPLVGSFNGFAY